MRVLFLSQRIPYPPNKGDKIRSFNILKHLSRHHEIYLGTLLETEQEWEYVGELQKLCRDVHAVPRRRGRLGYAIFSRKPFSVSHFYDERLQRYVDRVLKEAAIDAVFVYCSSMAEYIFRCPAFDSDRQNRIPTVIDYVDLDSAKWKQYAEFSKFPSNLIYRIENGRLFDYEVKVNRAFDHSCFTSQREVKLFSQQYPGMRNVSVIPNGVDYDYFFSLETAPEALRAAFLRQRRPAGGPILVFTGFMDYFANVDGVTWFCKEIFPRIRQEVPGTEFFIVGNKPADVVWDLSEIEGVTVTGFVPDIRPYYWWADVCVMPLRIARGIQNKVLEAMSCARAVVATRNASDGIVCSDGWDIRLADSARDFANSVIHLLQDTALRQSCGAAARENVVRNYSWDRNLLALDALI